MTNKDSRVLRLLEPQGEPDIIECDGRLYVPDKECEFIPNIGFALSAAPISNPSRGQGVLGRLILNPPTQRMVDRKWQHTLSESAI